MDETQRGAKAQMVRAPNHLQQYLDPTFFSAMFGPDFASCLDRSARWSQRVQGVVRALHTSDPPTAPSIGEPAMVAVLQPVANVDVSKQNGESLSVSPVPIDDDENPALMATQEPITDINVAASSVDRVYFDNDGNHAVDEKMLGAAGAGARSGESQTLCPDWSILHDSSAILKQSQQLQYSLPLSDMQMQSITIARDTRAIAALSQVNAPADEPESEPRAEIHDESYRIAMSAPTLSPQKQIKQIDIVEAGRDHEIVAGSAARSVHREADDSMPETLVPLVTTLPDDELIMQEPLQQVLQEGVYPPDGGGVDVDDISASVCSTCGYYSDFPLTDELENERLAGLLWSNNCMTADGRHRPDDIALSPVQLAHEAVPSSRSSPSKSDASGPEIVRLPSLAFDDCDFDMDVYAQLLASEERCETASESSQNQEIEGAQTAGAGLRMVVNPNYKGNMVEELSKPLSRQQSDWKQAKMALSKKDERLDATFQSWEDTPRRARARSAEPAIVDGAHHAMHATHLQPKIAGWGGDMTQSTTARTGGAPNDDDERQELVQGVDPFDTSVVAFNEPRLETSGGQWLDVPNGISTGQRADKELKQKYERAKNLLSGVARHASSPFP